MYADVVCVFLHFHWTYPYIYNTMFSLSVGMPLNLQYHNLGVSSLIVDNGYFHVTQLYLSPPKPLNRIYKTSRHTFLISTFYIDMQLVYPLYLLVFGKSSIDSITVLILGGDQGMFTPKRICVPQKTFGY